MKKNKIYFILILLLFLYVILAASSYTNAVFTDISQNIFRLHVIANSNSEEDQNLKYIVRDAVLDYINDISNGCTSKEGIITIVNNNIQEIKEVAQDAVYKEGFLYDVDLEIGNFSFPTKQYGDISFPPGFYDALRIKIGMAEGKNWWCVMFPPLCFIDTSSGIVPDESKELMKDNLSQEEFALLSTDNSDTKIKFKVVELLQNISIGGIFM